MSLINTDIDIDRSDNQTASSTEISSSSVKDKRATKEIVFGEDAPELEAEIFEVSANAESRLPRQLRPVTWQYSNGNFRSLNFVPSKQNSFISFDAFTSPQTPYQSVYKGPGNSNRFQPFDEQRYYSDFSSGSNKNFKPSPIRPVYENEEKGELSPFRRQTTQRPPLITPLYPVVYTSSNGAPPPKSQAPQSVYKSSNNFVPTTTPSAQDETIPDNFSFFHFRAKPTKPVHQSQQPQQQHHHLQSHAQGPSTQRNPFLSFPLIGNFFLGLQSFTGTGGGGGINAPSNNNNNKQNSQKAEQTFRPSPRRPDDDNTTELKPKLPTPTVLIPVKSNSNSNSKPSSQSNSNNKNHNKNNNYQLPLVQVTTLRPQTTGSAPSQSTKHVPITYATPTTFIITKQNGNHYSIRPSFVQITTPSIKINHNGNNGVSLATAIKNAHSAQLIKKPNTSEIGQALIKNQTKTIDQQYFKQQSTTFKPLPDNDDEYYYDDDDEVALVTTARPAVKIEPKLPKPSIKLIQNVNKIPSYIKQNPIETEEDDEYYDSDEYEDYDEEDDEKHYQPPPVRLNAPYRPASETAAPRPITTTTSRPVRPSTPWGNVGDRTVTTPQPTTTSTSIIPPIIEFPEDPFQNIKLDAFPRYLNRSTLRPYTVRQRLTPTNSPGVQVETTQVSPKRTVPPTSSTSTKTNAPTLKSTTKKVYTVRPNRGNQRWKVKDELEKNGTTIKTKPTIKRLTKGRLELDEKYANR